MGPAGPEFGSAVFPDQPEDHQSWPVCARLAPHVESVVADAASYPDMARQRGDLLAGLGIYLAASAQLKAGLSAIGRALAIKEEVYGPNHLEVAGALGNLGIVQQMLGELPAARVSLERARAIFEAAYGPDNPKVARTLANLGNVQWRLGELPAARVSLERARPFRGGLRS